MLAGNRLRQGRSSVELNQPLKDLVAGLLKEARGASFPLIERKSTDQLNIFDTQVQIILKEFKEKLKSQIQDEQGSEWITKDPTSKSNSYVSIIKYILRNDQSVNYYSYALKRFIHLEKNGKLPPKNDYFISSLNTWCTQTLSQGISLAKQEPESHRAFAMIFSACRVIHSVLSLSDVHSQYRDRVAFAQECYRYYDLLTTTGKSSAVLAYLSDKEQSSKHDREFWRKLYQRKNFPLYHLAEAKAEDLKTSFGVNLDLKQLKIDSPKIERTLKKIKQTKRKFPNVKILITCDRDIAISSIFDVLSEQEDLKKFNPTTLTGADNDRKRKNIIQNFSNGKIDILIASEIKIPDTFQCSSEVHIIPFAQHAIPLPQYPWIKSMIAGGVNLKIVPIVVKNTPDSAQRNRVKKRPVLTLIFSSLGSSFDNLMKSEKDFDVKLANFCQELQSELNLYKRKKAISVKINKGFNLVLNNKIQFWAEMYGQTDPRIIAAISSIEKVGAPFLNDIGQYKLPEK